MIFSFSSFSCDRASCMSISFARCHGGQLQLTAAFNVRMMFCLLCRMVTFAYGAAGHAGLQVCCCSRLQQSQGQSWEPGSCREGEGGGPGCKPPGKSLHLCLSSKAGVFFRTFVYLGALPVCCCVSHQLASAVHSFLEVLRGH